MKPELQAAPDAVVATKGLVLFNSLNALDTTEQTPPASELFLIQHCILS